MDNDVSKLIENHSLHLYDLFIDILKVQYSRNENHAEAMKELEMAVQTTENITLKCLEKYFNVEHKKG